MAFVGVGNIGFSPYEFKLQWPGVQNATVLNKAVALFNEGLKASIDSLLIDLPETTLTYLNTTGISSDGPAAPLSAITSCCKNIDTVSQITCKRRDSAICPDRAKALFFDNIHTTEAVNQAVAARYYTAKNPSDAIPYDIQTLALQ